MHVFCVLREFRALVIEMVLATDMSFHFQQIKNMKNMLSLPEKLVPFYFFAFHFLNTSLLTTFALENVPPVKRSSS